MSRRKKQQETIAYPVFRLIKEFTLDEFWCDILDTFSNGKLHPGIKVKDTCIFIGSEEFETSCFAEDGNLEQKAETSMSIINSLRSELGIMSDMEKFEEKFDTFSTEEKISSWSKVKSKAKRELFILRFAEKEQREKKLSREERQNLYWFLITAVDLGCIRPDDIEMEDGRIKAIRGLLFDSDTVNYRLEDYSFPVSKPSAKAKMSSKMGAALSRYLLSKTKELQCR